MSLQVTWDAVNWNGDQGSYEILRSVDGSSYSQIGSVSSGTTSYSDTGLTYGEKYWYKVRATNSAGSNTSSAVSATTALSAPTGVNATVDANDQITVSWTDTISNGNYHIQINRNNNGWVDPAGGSTTVGQDTTSVIYGPDSNIGVDSSFKFRVRCETEHTTSAWSSSETVYTDPISPSNPTFSEGDGTYLNVVWQNDTNIYDHVEIQYLKDSGSGYGSWTGANTDSGSSHTFDGGKYTWFELDSRFQFRLRTVAPDGDTSDWVYVTYDNGDDVYYTKPKAPINLHIDSMDSDSIAIGWETEQTFGESEIEYKKSSESSWTTLNTYTLGPNSDTINNLLNGERYNIRAVASAGRQRTIDIGNVLIVDGGEEVTESSPYVVGSRKIVRGKFIIQ